MRSRSLSLLAGLAVLLLPACSGSGAASGGTGTPADEQAIRAIAPAYAAAFSKHDAKAMAALSTEDYEDVDAMGVHTQGRAAIETNMGKQFAMMPANMAMTTTTTFVKFLSSTSAVAGGTWQTTPADGRATGQGRLDGRRGEEGHHLVDGLLTRRRRNARHGDARHHQAEAEGRVTARGKR